MFTGLCRYESVDACRPNHIQRMLQCQRHFTLKSLSTAFLTKRWMRNFVVGDSP